MPNKTSLTQALITYAVTIDALGACGGGTISSSVPRVTFTLSSHTITVSMHGATVGASPELATSTLVTRGAVAGTIHAGTVGRTILGASFHGAVETGPSLVADAFTVAALTMARAEVGAGTLGAVDASVSSLAEAGTVLADTVL